MRTTRSLGQLAVILLSLSHTVSAWKAWPRILPDIDALVVRQEGGNSPTPAPTGSNTATATGPKPPTSTNLNTGGATATGAKGNSTKTSAPKHTLYNPQDPAGGVVMITPAVTAGLQLYKIGDFVTFGWNYTNLQGTPTAVDVLVTCSKAQQTWTLTQNMTFTTKGAYTWDTGAYQSAAVQSQLPTEEYNLLIHDADGTTTDTPEAGYLAPFSGLKFGLYEPRKPTPLGEWKCASCSGAMGEMERRALGGAVAMSIMTVLSFTWFVGGFGALL